MTVSDSAQIVQSSADACDKIRASAHDARRQATLSRRVVDQSRQLREKVLSQELRVMGAETTETVSDSDRVPALNPEGAINHS